MTRHVNYDIIIPPLGDRALDCQLSEWLVAVGDYVKEGAPLLILESEKSAIEIPAPADGTLAEVYVFEGEEVIESERVGVIRADVYEDEDGIGGFDDEDDEYEDDLDEDDEDYDLDDDDEDDDDDDDDFGDDDEDDDDLDDEDDEI